MDADLEAIAAYVAEQTRGPEPELERPSPEAILAGLRARRPGLIVPEPSPRFRALVEAELATARRRALAVAPRPIREHVRHGSRWDAGQVQTVRRSPGRCVGCGCDLDDRSPGCANCGSRHAMRARQANARSLADAA